MTLDDRRVILDRLREVVADRGLRYSTLHKAVTGDARILLPTVNPDNANAHNRPSWDRLMMWARQLGFEPRFVLEEREPAKRQSHDASLGMQNR